MQACVGQMGRMRGQFSLSGNLTGRHVDEIKTAR